MVLLSAAMKKNRNLLELLAVCTIVKIVVDVNRIFRNALQTRR